MSTQSPSGDSSTPQAALVPAFELSLQLAADLKLPADWLGRIEAVLSRFNAFYGAAVRLGPARVSPLAPPRTYAVLVGEWVAGSGMLWPGYVLAVPPGDRLGEALAGYPGLDPISGAPAWWVRDDEVGYAQEQGYRTADAAGVLAGHLEAIACRLLSQG